VTTNSSKPSRKTNRRVRVTVLVENTAQGTGLLAEHGLAFWVDWNGHKVLFDTGQGFVLTGNAHKLGASLGETDAIVLSHGHYDHTGGLADTLIRCEADVYLHPAALKPKFACNKLGITRDIGIPFPAKKILQEQDRNVVKTESPTHIYEGLTVTGAIPRVTDFEDTGGPFFLDAACSKPDPINDDQSMFFEAKQGIVVVLGCAHSGIINILRYINQLTGGKPIHAVLGGLHLVQASPERISRTIDELKHFNLGLLAPAHCTGLVAAAALRQAFPNHYIDCHVGSRFQFDLPQKTQMASTFTKGV